MNPLWKFVLILLGLLVLGMGVLLAFRAVDSGVEPKISLPSFGGGRPTGIAFEPIVVTFRDVGGRAVLRNYRIEVRAATPQAAVEMAKTRTKLRDAFVVQLLDLSRHPWHSPDAPAREVVERRLMAAAREATGAGIVQTVVVTKITESPAP